MILHKIAWFEANVGKTIYPVFSERTKQERKDAAQIEAKGIFIENIAQAHLLYNNQIQVGTRYLRDEERTVPA